VRASRIGGRVILAGIPDRDAYTLSASDARRRGLKIKFVRQWATTILAPSTS
jgi:L-iditol 2-dehydrogenase